MALLDLSLVTQALLRLISAHVTNSPEWVALTPLEVMPQPPDQLRGEHTIGLYLYHIVEDPHYKNLPSPGDGKVPLQFTPMGLTLYYQLSAHSELGGENGPFEEQRLMGLAMKALRDNPVIDDSTVIGGVPPFPPALAGRDNRLRITLQPVQAGDAVQYWTASQLLRLATYYQVDVALLEPEPIRTRAGRVLTYGVHTFLRGSPRLDGSRNRVEFTIPGEASPRAVELRPAEVAVGSQVTFYGTELSDAATFLLIKAAGWSEFVEVDAIQWGVTATFDRVLAEVQEVAGDETVLPGIYAAAVKVVTQRTMPDGSTRHFEKTSNQTPFAVTPRVEAVNIVAGLATVTGLNFDPALLPDEAIQVFLGPDRLTRVDAGVPAAGEFRPVSRTDLRFRFPAGLVAGDQIPLRILIQGAESAPRWVTAP